MAADADVQPLPSRRWDVRRIGATVVRDSGPWSRSVHALLRHLEAVGFSASPRVVGSGFDRDGREVISYTEGEVVHPNSWSDEGLAALGVLLRDFHEASARFVPPSDAVWQGWFTRSGRAGAVVGHGDIGPWNIVAREGLPVGFIDWEFAGPVDRLAEVALAAWLNVQLHEDGEPGRTRLPTPEVRARRLGVFVDAYGLEVEERAGLVPRMIGYAIRDATDEIRGAGRLRMACAPTRPEDPGWAVAWRVATAAWLVRNRSLLERAVRI